MLYYSLVCSASDFVHVMLFRREQSSESCIFFQSQMEILECTYSVASNRRR